MNKNKVRAFTIMEVTIAMLISAIVIGITYTIYTIVTKSYNSFNIKNENVAVVLRLDELLKKDFDHAEFILKTSNGISVQNPSGNITYQFDPDFVVRAGLITDTFKVKTDSLYTSFENNVIGETGTTDEQNTLDELGFSLILQNEKITYYYHKIYSSVNLFNRKPDAIN
jgi:hypothetical protein